jgi:hypothetical protein
MAYYVGMMQSENTWVSDPLVEMTKENAHNWLECGSKGLEAGKMCWLSEPRKSYDARIAQTHKRAACNCSRHIDGGSQSGTGIICTGAFDPYVLRARKQDPCDFETGWDGPMRIEPERQR